MINLAVLQHKRTQPRPVAGIGRRIGATGRGELFHRFRDLAGVHGMAAALVVVFDQAFALLRFGEVDIEVGGEVAIGGRGPGEGPAHSALVGLQFRQGCAGYRHQGHVVVRQVDDDGVEAIGDG
ncbi:hypothetical protein D3C80_1339430 [compost metagenome]